MGTPRVIVLHSGGLDSTVCLLLARRHGREPISFGLNYGQKHDVELDYAAKQCTRFGIERRLIDVAALEPDDRTWIDAYHTRVLAEIGPRVGSQARLWLTKACAPL